MSTSTHVANVFGRFVARCRKSTGLGVRELARAAHVSHVQLLHIEEGKRQPGVGTALKIASALGLGQKQWSKIVSRQLLGPSSVTTSLAPSDWFAALVASTGVDAKATGSHTVEVTLSPGRKVKVYVEDQ